MKEKSVYYVSVKIPFVVAEDEKEIALALMPALKVMMESGLKPQVVSKFRYKVNVVES